MVNNPTSVGVDSKIRTSTTNLADATGDVAYTGAGFRPRAVVAHGCVNSSCESFGQGDIGLVEGNIYRATGGTGFTDAAGILRFDKGGAAYQVAVLKSLDADGMTLTWTKTGLPTGSANLRFLYLR